MCAPQGTPEKPSSGKSATVFVAVKGDASSLELWVKSGWQNAVPVVDRSYISDLIQDFKERAAHDPEALFKQLSQLEAGILTTGRIGTSPRDGPALRELLTGFQRI